MMNATNTFTVRGYFTVTRAARAILAQHGIAVGYGPHDTTVFPAALADLLAIKPGNPRDSATLMSRIESQAGITVEVRDGTLMFWKFDGSLGVATGIPASDDAVADVCSVVSLLA